MPKIEIRVATAADVYPMSDLMERLVRRHQLRDATGPGGRVLLSKVAPEALCANLASGYAYHVAASDADLFGVIAIRGFDRVHQVYVADPVRRSGLGRRLWEAARDEICIHATAPALFVADVTPNAVPFFRALGFQPGGEEQLRDGVRWLPMRYVLLGMGGKAR